MFWQAVDDVAGGSSAVDHDHDHKIGESYLARKALFAKGLRQGWLTIQEIDQSLPEGSLTAAERWLLYYSLRAAEIEIIDEETGVIDHGFPMEPLSTN